MPDLAHVLTLPEGLTPEKWAQIESYLEDWKRETQAAVLAHPARSWQLGQEQTFAFLNLMGKIGSAMPAPQTLGPSLATSEGIGWQETYTLHEVSGALDAYLDKIKSALLYGLRGVVNPAQVASLMYKATQDGEVNWRMIARTEMVRANAEGRLAASLQQGYEQVWAPPHIGSCKRCRELLEGRVFNIADVQGVTNFGRDPHQWVACIPLHPHCRHIWLPYVKEAYDDVQEQLRKLSDQGLTEGKINEMFDSSGQLKPGYEASMFKTADPYQHILATAVHKVATNTARFPGDIDDPIDRAPERYDQLVFDGDRLRPEIRDRLVSWWRCALGPDAPLWSHLFLFADKGSMPVTIVVDYDELRGIRPSYSVLSSPEIHAALLTQLRVATEGTEGAPGVPLSVSIIPEQDLRAFRQNAGLGGHSVFDVGNGQWDYQHDGDPRIHGSMDPVVAIQHPDWMEATAALVAALESSLTRYQGDPTELEEIRELFGWLREQRDSELGRFMWTFLLEHGPLLEVQALLHATTLKTVMPDYAWEVCKAEADWGNTYPGSWPLPVGVQVQALGQLFVIAERESGGVYKTMTGERILHEVVAKATKLPSAPNTGIEHWITIHPHGEAEPGQPVLVRNNSDGTMSVIGGAGGHLNYLRLDPSKRIAPKADKEETSSEGPQEKPMSEDEAAAAHEEHQKKVAEAQHHLSIADSDKKDVIQRAKDFVLGINPNGLKKQIQYVGGEKDGQVDTVETTEAEQKKALQAYFDSALYTLVHGQISAKDANSAPPLIEKIKAKAGEEAPLPETPDEQARRLGDELGLLDESEPVKDPAEAKEKVLLAPVSLSPEEAQSLMLLHQQLRQIDKARRALRRQIGGDVKPSDALAINWSEGVPEGVVKRVADEKRTQLARDLLKETEANSSQSRVKKAMVTGGLDSLDAFSSALLGRSVLSRDTVKLMGIGGSAQLIAHNIRLEAAKQGPEFLQKAVDTLNEHTDALEKKVVERGLTRAKVMADQALMAAEQIKESQEGNSLGTETMWRSLQQEALQGASRQLGMMTAGLEAASALKTQLDPRNAGGDMLKVGGFQSPSQILDLAKKAGIKIEAGEITKVANGNYRIQVPMDRFEGLLKPEKAPNQELRDRLEKIRTSQDMREEVEAQRSGPGMSDTLDSNQARGKMWLRAAGSGLLAFDPGVGKTHTAIAAAMDRMAAEPDAHHRALIVCPKAVAETWAQTIKQQGGSHTVQIIGGGMKDNYDAQSGQIHKQYQSGADFNIVTYEALKGHAGGVDRLGHTIVISDELQKAKNEGTGNFKGVERAVRVAHENATGGGSSASFYGLTGTPIEKTTGDVTAMQNLVRIGRGEDKYDIAAARSKFDKLGLDEHIARGDKVAQFRERNDDTMYRLLASEAGEDVMKYANPAETHEVELTKDHRQSLVDTVKGLNEMRAQIAAGTLPAGAVAFGGRQALLDATYNYGLKTDAKGKPIIGKDGMASIDESKTNSLASSLADRIAGTGSFDFEGMPKPVGDKATYQKGDNAGTYEHKHVVFTHNKQPMVVVKHELEKRGIKVFMSHGGLSPKEREKVMEDFRAHKGKAVFLTNKTNEAGVSLQFGDHKGNFQYGATHLHHYEEPVNNASIQQRNARILRKGVAAQTHHHHYDAGTAAEQRQRQILEREARTQDLAGNSSQEVAGDKTVRQRLKEKGVKSVLASQREAK